MSCTAKYTKYWVFFLKLIRIIQVLMVFIHFISFLKEIAVFAFCFLRSRVIHLLPHHDLPSS